MTTCPQTPRLAFPWQPRAHFASLDTTDTSTWLLDSGASHHVTVDLNNLSLHTPYAGSDDVMIGDDTGLHITHTGSTTILTPTRTFNLHNILCVPNMKKNLISIYQFCNTNHVSIEFLPTIFHVKDLSTGTIFLTRNTKDASTSGKPPLQYCLLRSLSSIITYYSAYYVNIFFTSFYVTKLSL